MLQDLITAFTSLREKNVLRITSELLDNDTDAFDVLGALNNSHKKQFVGALHRIDEEGLAKLFQNRGSTKISVALREKCFHQWSSYFPVTKTR